MSCPIKVNSNTIELSVHTSCYFVYTYSVLNVKSWKSYNEKERVICNILLFSMIASDNWSKKYFARM